MFLQYLFLAGLATNTLIPSIAASLWDMQNCRQDPNKFLCHDGECIDRVRKCDSYKHCSDGSDESDCDNLVCNPPLFFKCNNQRCISHFFLCDGEDECGDNSDEQDCNNFQKNLTVASATCSQGEWQCSDRLCIPEEWVCNGDFDCLDGSDETLGCSKSLPCDGFKCDNGHCIPKEWRCDKNNDCGDNSDETDCENTIDPKNCRLEENLFLCANNRTCLPLDQVCNDTPECPDGSDEGSECKNIILSCMLHSCSHNCTQLPKGPKCFCPKGYRTKDDRTCEDIDECETYGICDQKCTNTPGSYECTCDKKYILQEDGRTCKAEGGEAMMVFSSKTQIRGYFLQSQLYFPIANRLKQVIGVGFDGHYVYWTDIFSGHESIVRSTEDGANRELLVTSGLGAPEDLAIDWITGNIYFTDSEMQHIGVCSKNGEKCTVIVNKDIDKPRGIALNPAEGEMFWTDWGSKPLIGRSLMDGSQFKEFVTDNIRWPNGLTIDYPNERLYWVDAKHQTLESIALSGADRRVILEGIVKHPYAIAVFEDKLYWSDWNTHSIQTCDKFTGKNHHTLLKEKKEYVYGLHIFHSALKQQGRDGNPCDRAFCSDLCLLSGRTYSCACTQDKVLSADKHVCIPYEKKQILIIGGGDLLAQVEHRNLGKHEVSALPTIATDIIALAYSSENSTVFVSDAATGAILATSLTKGGETDVVYHGDGDTRISSMAYDYAGNNLYWCDTGKGTVEIFSLRTMARKVLMHDMAGELPTAIALVPDEGVMFIAFKRTESGYHVDRFRMDGTGRTHIIDQGLVGPVTLFYEFGLRRIFWADAGTGAIETTSVDGDDRHGFRSLHTNPISLASLNRDIFWTNDRSKRLVWTNKLNTDYDREITLDLPDSVRSLYIVSGTSRPVQPYPCHVNNGNCSHLCIPIEKGLFACSCPLGMSLRADNSTCSKPLSCSAGEFFCRKSDACVPSTAVCNGHRDCVLGDDEEDCPEHRECDRRDEFKCKDGSQCVKTATVCDMHYDCADESDEDAEMCAGDVYKKKCPEGNFQCNSGTCISNRFLCDGFKDCYENEDEVDCKFLTCAADQFRCVTGSCIPKTWECDKQYDCYDLSDEHAGCEYASSIVKCSYDQFTCKNGRCIDESLRCDRSDDCGDLSDETDCREGGGKDEDGKLCRDILDFQCASDRRVCLPQSAVCNGTAECPHMEDEKDCSDCHLDEFKCDNGKCLSREWICDGVDDCGDASDEGNGLCSRKNETAATAVDVQRSKTSSACTKGFRCKNGNCLDLSFVCNGQEDCYDGSDENGACNTSCQGKSNPCDQKCVPTPSGPTCVCHDGYKLLGDGQTCVDIKECGLEPPICSQLCTELPGSFSCDCRKGYMLRPDKKSCKSIGEPMSMIFVSNNQIRRLNQLTNTLSVLYSDNTPEITGLDVHTALDAIYFSIKESGTIHRLNANSLDRDYITNAGSPTKLAVDWVTQNVYYVDASGYEASVKVCNFDRKSTATLFPLEAHSQVSAIALDPLNKYLFYATTKWYIFNSPTSTVYRRSLDGVKIIQVVKSLKGHVTGLAVDPYARKMYFADQHNGMIYKTGYEDGDGDLAIASNLSHPRGLDLFEDHLFFKSRNGYMGKCKLFGDDATRNCDQFRMGGSTGDLFVISQISKQPRVEDVCAAANCTVMCVRTDAGPKCICSDGKAVPQGETCVADSVSAFFILCKTRKMSPT
ncbi:vitellogenin receptor-like protein-related-related [Holotrichia oblita]|uniref:Vitellogenin receptor-like protein-related-related n=1 Tax=Holotrichia oblita TaxID=644536 RepID=A0ACB9TIP5_HOLOL|nr:vitellogenin receptor-like protein-related-related [Holotrichia oblita]